MKAKKVLAEATPKLDLTEMRDLRAIRKDCSCVTTFTKESNYTVSRLDACQEHGEFTRVEDRTRIVAEARAKKKKFFAEVSEKFQKKNSH